MCIQPKFGMKLVKNKYIYIQIVCMHCTYLFVNECMLNNHKKNIITIIIKT